jgi:hypothetical protein
MRRGFKEFENVKNKIYIVFIRPLQQALEKPKESKSSEILQQHACTRRTKIGYMKNAPFDSHRQAKIWIGTHVEPEEIYLLLQRVQISMWLCASLSHVIFIFDLLACRQEVSRKRNLFFVQCMS